jgi:hypothetical protein
MQLAGVSKHTQAQCVELVLYVRTLDWSTDQKVKTSGGGQHSAAAHFAPKMAVLQSQKCRRASLCGNVIENGRDMQSLFLSLQLPQIVSKHDGLKSHFTVSAWTLEYFSQASIHVAHTSVVVLSCDAYYRNGPPRLGIIARCGVMQNLNLLAAAAVTASQVQAGVQNLGTCSNTGYFQRVTDCSYENSCRDRRVEESLSKCSGVDLNTW